MARSDTARLHTRGLFSGKLSMKGGPWGQVDGRPCTMGLRWAG